MSTPRVVKLKTPIDMGSEQICELTFRRGRFDDMKGIGLNLKEAKIDDLMLLASRLCGQPVAVLGKIDEDDVGEVMAIASDFFLKCLGAGSEA